MARLNDFMVRADLTPMVEYCREFGVPAVYEKGEAFVTEGSVCRYVGLVLSGYFKYSMLDTSGNERIAGFGFENEIITDFVRSVQFGQPAWTSIVAGCKSEILRVPLPEILDYLAEHNPIYIANVSKHVLAEAYSRSLMMLKLSPLERYQALYPRLVDVIDMIPIQELASFFGISRRQFQRIRSSK